MATPLITPRARDHPQLRRHRGPVLAQPMTQAPDVELGNPLTVAEDPSIGYGRPVAGEPEPLRVTSVEVCPVVALLAVDEHGNEFELAGSLDMFLPFARQLLAINDAMPTVVQPAPEYREPDYGEPQSQAG